MSGVQLFNTELEAKTQGAYAKWHKVDLHNHSPSSFDYEGDPSSAVEDSATAINSAGLSIVMFTDHGKLPAAEFIRALATRTKALILRGVEFNIFVDAFGKSDSKVHREAFFHLLVGFDPDNDHSPEYWLEAVYQQRGREDRSYGGQTVQGVKGGIEGVLDVLAKSNAIALPAHLHTVKDAFRSRSVDDIYDDEQFLALAPRFTALEVVNPKTAALFDGKHAQTKNIEVTCIRSSDAHRADRLGSRPTWALMQNSGFKELKAALELRSRVSIDLPTQADSYIVGAHIDGQYLKDMWLALSPRCNMFIGVKGSGKTAALECLRFALGITVPSNSNDQVTAHLSHILGSAGRVRVLLRRTDGSLVLVQRTMSNRDRFELTFEDGRTESLSQPQALGFAAQILGWHEIEHAATDVSVRRKYLDAIAGHDDVARIESSAASAAGEIKYLHEQAASRYQSFRTLHDQVKAKEELRRGLQELKDQNLTDLRDEYERAISHRDQLKVVTNSLVAARRELSAKTTALVPFANPIMPGTSPLDAQIANARHLLQKVLLDVESFGSSLDGRLEGLQSDLAAIAVEADAAFGSFASRYDEQVSKLTDEQRRLLDSHRLVMDQTRDLPSLRLRLDQAKGEVQSHLHKLIDMCAEVIRLLESRSALRRSKLDAFQLLVAPSNVKLALVGMQRSDMLDSYATQFREGFSIFGTIQSKFGAGSLHERLKKAYEELLGNLIDGFTLFFTQAEFSHYLTLFENDDLAISFDPQGAGYRPIDQLSAGQRCTAMFPVLLKLKNGPLVIDQPEDNLDNRHIASIISPAVATDKGERQMIMTSHNANLLVLSDPENVVVFEGLGNTGEIVAQGFLATRDSTVTQHVLEILDGGERALELRYAKYGRRAAP